MKPTATGGNEPKVKGPASQFLDAKKEAIKTRPRPTKKAMKYSVAADGNVTLSMNDLCTAITAKEDHAKYEADLKLWYEQQGVCQEPMLRGESLEQYKARTGYKD